MKTPPLDYAAPEGLEAAIRLLERTPGARPLAGGQSLLVDLKLDRQSAALLVDLRKLPELRGIQMPRIETSAFASAPKATVVMDPNAEAASRTGLMIGALTTCAEIAAHRVIQLRYAALAEAAASLGDPQVRHRSTLGGNLAQNDPAGDLQAAVLALGGALHLAGPYGPRSLPASRFFTGPRQTALQPGEIITAVELNTPDGLAGSAYEKMKNPASGYAICGAAAYLELLPNKTICRVAVSGAFENPLELEEIGEALSARLPTPEKIKAAVGRARLAQPGRSDLFASGEYRVHLARVLAERALLRALKQAQA